MKLSLQNFDNLALDIEARGVRHSFFSQTSLVFQADVIRFSANVIVFSADVTRFLTNVTRYLTNVTRFLTNALLKIEVSLIPYGFVELWFGLTTNITTNELIIELIMNYRIN